MRCISWEVRKPSKQCMKAYFALMADRCATAARSIASWGEADISMA